ncbi:MAG TPA: hypothetical protein VMZ52_15600 [Bryobacteraceae bacterium]|nr:hypothetical protein [Bryobacteraceae bacterium]
MKYPYLQYSLWIIGLVLQYLVISALLGGAYKRFIAVSLYAVAIAVTGLLEIFIVLDGSVVSREWRRYFWINEMIRQTGLYCVVVSLVLHAMPKSQTRAMLIRLFVGIAFLFWAGCILAYFDANKVNYSMTLVIRNISFCSAIITLILWFVLIASEKKDLRLLLITGGIGIQVTGEAIGQSLRQLSSSTVLAGNLLTVFSGFACLYIWWQTFHKLESPPARLPSPFDARPVEE